MIQITGHIVNLIGNVPNPRRRGQSVQAFPLSEIAIFNPAFSLCPDFRCRVERLNRRSIFHDSIIRNKGSIRICYVNDSAKVSGLKCPSCIFLDNITDLRNDIACIYIQLSCNVAVHNLNVDCFAVINAV